jgi:tRNA-modifying protein YgfZ
MMHPQRQAFLADIQLTTPPDLQAVSALLALPQLSGIEISGVQAKRFLQGQLTCDLEEVSLTQTRLGGYCNPQGRLRTLFRLLQTTDSSYCLLLPQELIASVMPVLIKYGQFDRLKIRDLSEEQYHIGYAGPIAALAAYFGTLPEANHAAVKHQDLTVINVSALTELPQFEIIGPLPSIVTCWEILQQHASAIASHYWDAFAIAAGLPRITTATTEHFLPHDLNLPALQAVSFQKGCYVGQEIIARMHYRGKPKRHLYRFQIMGKELPAPGSPVWGTDANTEKEVGNLVMAATTWTGTLEGLAVIDDKALTLPLYLQNVGKLPLERLDLPYMPR